VVWFYYPCGDPEVLTWIVQQGKLKTSGDISGLGLELRLGLGVKVRLSLGLELRLGLG
jgi:hypothetical protein